MSLNPPPPWATHMTTMVSCIDHIQRSLAGMTYQQFLSNPKTIANVTHQLERLGRAAARVPTEVELRYPQLDLNQMKDHRHTHTSRIWNYATQTLPALRPMLDNLAHGRSVRPPASIRTTPRKIPRRVDLSHRKKRPIRKSTPAKPDNG